MSTHTSWRRFVRTLAVGRDPTARLVLAIPGATPATARVLLARRLADGTIDRASLEIRADAVKSLESRWQAGRIAERGEWISPDWQPLPGGGREKTRHGIEA